jgi:hypothetical protein
MTTTRRMMMKKRTKWIPSDHVYFWERLKYFLRVLPQLRTSLFQASLGELAKEP